MDTYTIAIERITYYEVRAESIDEAINLALQGEGEEIDQKTTHAYDAAEGY